jgi:hypothetical protein
MNYNITYIPFQANFFKNQFFNSLSSKTVNMDNDPNYLDKACIVQNKNETSIDSLFKISKISLEKFKNLEKIKNLFLIYNYTYKL